MLDRMPTVALVVLNVEIDRLPRFLHASSSMNVWDLPNPFRVTIRICVAWNTGSVARWSTEV